MSRILNVVGAGVQGVDQLTLQSARTIKQSEKIFTLGSINDIDLFM
ncbi:hypothetical protein [Candidatus Sororendozoicomonas aggregata]